MVELQRPFRALTKTEFAKLSTDEKIGYVLQAVEHLEPKDFNDMMESFGVGATLMFANSAKSQPQSE